jgi:hypothetical protein
MKSYSANIHYKKLLNLSPKKDIKFEPFDINCEENSESTGDYKNIKYIQSRNFMF